MNKFVLYIALLILPLAVNSAFGQYTLNNTGGKINNSGTIRVKNGQVKALPDTIGGRVEFLQKNDFSQQTIPNIVYNQLVLRNSAKKIILDDKDSNNNVKHLVVRDSLIVGDNADFTTQWVGSNPLDILAKGHVDNTAKYSGPRQLIMSADAGSQNLLGNGRFSYLNIDNPLGVNVIGGGFTVENTLTLTRGLLKNSATENFTMSDSSLIVRYAGASLSEKPNLEKTVSISYKGNGDIETGPELPNSDNALNNLIVDNSGYLNMKSNAVVNDSLYVGTYVNTGSDTLVLATRKTTVFNTDNPSAQIDGTIKVPNIPIDSTKILLHNPYTYAIFNDAQSANGTRDLIVTIKPRTFSSMPGGNSKVKRAMKISGYDQSGNEVKTGVNMIFGYGWRHLPGDTLDESNNLPYKNLILQGYNQNSWEDILSSQVPELTNKGWAYSHALTINSFGDFAIGMSGGLLTINAKVFLEGAYRFGSMADDLRQKGYITVPPPDVYPYNLDPARQFIRPSVLPDSVVDWVVLEFREKFTEKGKFRTYLIKQNGQIVDEFGNSEIAVGLGMNDSGKIDSGNYYIAVRHRNHLAVITKDYVALMPGIQKELDFSAYDFVMGGASSLKQIDVNKDGSSLYGLAAGESNDIFDKRSVIDTDDYNTVIPPINTWTVGLFEGYLVKDFDMNGIITTKDFNLSFNNRGRVSALPYK